jgi:cell division protein FtsQ
VSDVAATADAPVPFAGPRRAPVVSTGVADRLAERDAMRRHRRRRRLGWTVACAVAVLALAWLVFFSPALATHADDVRVVGAGDLVDVAAVHAVVADADGVPLPRLDTVALRSHLLDVRGVGDVAISREWPHGLLVRITPRSPVAAVPDDGRFALLDGQGVQIAVVAKAPKGVPVVSVPLGASDHRTLDAVLVVLGGLPASISRQVTAVSASTQDAVQLSLGKDVTVVWGSDQDTALKAKVLQALRKAKESKHAHVFDVSAPTLPVTR